MFLKLAQKISNKPKSITAQLTLFYSLAIFLILAGIASLSYIALKDVLFEINQQFLLDELNVMKSLLAHEVGDKGIKQEIQDVPNLPNAEHRVLRKESLYRYYIRVTNVNNKHFLETPLMRQRLASADFFNQQVLSKQSEILAWQSPEHRHYLLLSALYTPPYQNTTYLIQMALDITQQKDVIRECRDKLILSLNLGLLVAVLFGFMIAKKGLRNLQQLTETTRQITVHSLHARLSPDAWPVELRALGQAFNEMLERIEHAFHKLTQFSSDLAHELRTPINNLMGVTEINLARDLTVAEYQAVLTSNLEECNRIAHIIENLLFLARADNLQINLQKTTLNIFDEVQTICEYYQAMAEEKNIQLHCQGKAEAQANQVMFRRMISNVLSNALKYTASGGAVHVNIESKVGKICLRIEDNGCGISAQHLPRLFERFYRVDASRSLDSGGVGLGLAIVKSIVDLHGGQIEVLSQAGQGTTVVIHLPMT